MLVSSLRPPQELRSCTSQHLLVARPALQRGAREAVDLELEVRVAQHGGVER